jgi:hypothetical protein
MNRVYLSHIYINKIIIIFWHKMNRVSFAREKKQDQGAMPLAPAKGSF